MAWRIEFDTAAEKDLRKLDRQWQRRIVDHLEETIALDDPRARGKALSGSLAGLWRYRVGDYRVICQILDDIVIVRVIKIGHRRAIYE